MSGVQKANEKIDTDALVHKLDTYIETAKTNNDTFRQPIHDKEPRTVLRRRQVDVFIDIRNFIASGEKAGYVTLPTGTGKTVIFTEVINAAEKLPAIIVVPTNVLVRQTSDKLKVSAPNLNVGIVNAYVKEYDKQVVVTTYASLIRAVEKGIIDPEKFMGILVLDEAHLALTTRKMNAISEFKNAIKIGFTATPQYSESKKVDIFLPKLIHQMSIEEASKEGLIADFTNLQVDAYAIDLSSVKITYKGSKSDFNEKDLEKQLNIPVLTEAVVKIYKTGFDGEKAIVYCTTIKHADDVAEAFRKAGIRALSVNSKLQKSEQDSIVSMFRTGEIDVICNPLLLTLGFDEPTIKVGLNVRPTLSTVLETQRSGRALRIDESDPYKMKYIVDFVYKNSDSRKIPVTFAEVAGAPVMRRRSEHEVTSLQRGAKKNRRLSNLDRLKVEGFRVITEERELMRMAKGRSEHRELMGKGIYRHLTDIAKEMGVESSSLKLHADKFILENPSKILLRGKHVYYPLEFVKYVSKMYKPVPQKHMSLHMIAIKLKMTPLLLKDDAKKFEDENPSKVVTQNYAGRKFYPMEFFRAMEKKFRLKKDLIRLGTISKRFHIAGVSVLKEAEEFKRNNPGMVARRGNAEYYPPEFLKAFQKKYNDTKGYISSRQVQARLRSSACKRDLKKFEKDHPEKIRRRGSRIFYPEEFVKGLEKKYRDIPGSYILSTEAGKGLDWTVDERLDIVRKFSEESPEFVVRRGNYIFLEPAEFFKFLKAQRRV